MQVLYLGIHGLCIVMQGRAGKEAYKLRGKALGRGLNEIINFGIFGIAMCFVEDVKTLWSKHAFTFACNVANACHLWDV